MVRCELRHAYVVGFRVAGSGSPVVGEMLQMIGRIQERHRWCSTAIDAVKMTARQAAR